MDIAWNHEYAKLPSLGYRIPVFYPKLNKWEYWDPFSIFRNSF